MRRTGGRKARWTTARSESLQIGGRVDEMMSHLEELLPGGVMAIEVEVRRWANE